MSRLQFAELKRDEPGSALAYKILSAGDTHMQDSVNLTVNCKCKLIDVILFSVYSFLFRLGLEPEKYQGKKIERKSGGKKI